jgi:hypothetical protein
MSLYRSILVIVLTSLSLTLPASAAAPATRPWLGVHIGLSNDATAAALSQQAPKLAAMGVNVLVVEVNYGFQYTSHPEVASPRGLSKEGARALAQACRQNGIRLIPQFNCLGHQSWSSNTAALLTKHPEFDETPGQYPNNKGIYCRSWCPLHPDVNKFVFDLMDELIDAFQADAFHVGMDEVFLIGSEFCPRCKGRSAAELFAKAVNDYHDHLVGQRHVEMLMWSDRFLDGKATGYGKWEASENGTAPAIDLVPKDIICCDWHYGKRAEYPSIPIFLAKGFRVWPGGWDKVDATEALMAAEHKYNNDRMLGHMCTTWGKARPSTLADFPPLQAAAKTMVQ